MLRMDCFVALRMWGFPGVSHGVPQGQVRVEQKQVRVFVLCAGFYGLDLTGEVLPQGLFGLLGFTSALPPLTVNRQAVSTTSTSH